MRSWRAGEASERAFWRDYAGDLRALSLRQPGLRLGRFPGRGLRPPGGRVPRVTARLADLGEPIDFDPFDEIVTKNLYGVDLNAKSVEIPAWRCG